MQTSSAGASRESCQPWSTAGKRRGAADPRHLWPEMARVIAECRPRFVFAENVSLAAFAEPWRDLRGLGYRVPPAVCISAADVGAPHIRKRWWLLAADADCYQHEGSARPHQGATAERLPDVADSKGLGRGARRPEPAGEQGRPGAAGGGASMADADGQRLEERSPQPRNGGEELAPVVGGRVGDTNGVRELQPQGCQPEEWRRVGDAGWWATEPDVGRVAHRVPARVDRLRALGNAQVPLQAATAFAELMARLGGREGQEQGVCEQIHGGR